MRERIGNPFGDQHYLFRSWDMYIYDFVAQPTDPHSVSQAIEYVIPALCVFGRGTILKERIWIRDHFEEREVYMQDYDPTKQGWINGAVWTSWRHDFVRDEPCLYIAVGLYENACNDNKRCLAGHVGYNIKQASRVQKWQLDAAKEEIGEHPRLRLGIRQDKDNEVLHELGFTRIDAPLKALVG